MAFTQSFRVGWIDTDASGRIHFTAVFRWVETTEMALLRSLDLLGADTGDFPRRQVEAEYLKVLSFEDELDVQLSVERLGRTSITFAWEIVSRGAVAVRGRHTAVRVDANGRPRPLDETLRTALAGAAHPQLSSTSPAAS